MICLKCKVVLCGNACKLDGFAFKKKSQNMWNFPPRLAVLELENISHYKNVPGLF